MYQVVVVEDEHWIRSAVIKMIEQTGDAFEVIGEASNGDEALQLIETALPMIVITDIMMPVRDGLWLVKEIYDRKLPIVSILLSGYNEFEYAKQALQYQVSDYLLKPVLEEEVEQALRRAKTRTPQFQGQRPFFLGVQQFFDKLGTTDPQSVLKEQQRLVDAVVRADTLTTSEKTVILKSFSSKFQDSIVGLHPSFARVPFPGIGTAELEAHFQTLTESWLLYFNALHQVEMRQTIRNACEFIQARYCEDLSLSDMTQRFHISASQFSLLFKKYTGQSFVQYVNSIRIQEAKRLLVEDKLKVYEVAEQVGFQSLPHFNRVFKQYVGSSPNDYKKGLSV
ncbi:helix-turn-helix domain-containing protein [Paenibacillus sp.]|uniref:response regulator transcription factor n=1 Tax=Paenibacillus sp. TaxID=58172 RepID=UPI002D52E8F6|nr:helix-turn-helix domain-containing protein [Paenibacillus sp.]HZG85418.1 helix-turn-helix domain-containing protein [Paenibacillus sp.]